MRKSQDMYVATTADEFIHVLSTHTFSWVCKKAKKTGKRTYYVDLTATLDIEDYATAEDGYIYSIAVCIDNERCVLRYMEDVIDLFNRLENEFGLNDSHKLVVYVHNLGHEHYHMTQIFAEKWGFPRVLLTKPTKPLTLEYDNGIQFRDSFKLFQKSLAGATKGCVHAKMVGDLDYNKKFTPDTPLSPDEWNYIVNDVQGLYEAIERLKAQHGFDQASIPYTNTGMVIEEVNKSKDANSMRAMAELMLCKHDMKLAYECMAGGDTHGCRWRAGITYENCNSYDLKSAHPSQQILWKFPKGKPIQLGEGMEDDDLDAFTADGNHYWFGKVYIYGVHCKDECPNPTVSISKCEEVSGLGGVDNGRVLDAEAIIVYMDSNDWWRFKRAYDYEEMVAVDVVGGALGYLPQAFRNAILAKFILKESAPEGPERAFAKVCVNTIFGACAQKTVRDEYALEMNEIMETTKTAWRDNLSLKDDEAVLKSQKNKFPFLWGLWTASMSRLTLFKLQMAVGWERLIYWDTDSCKYEGEKLEAVEKFNDVIRAQCIERNAVVKNRKGKEVYIGVAEDEHPTVAYGYRKFRFLHAKCYAAEAWNGKEYEIETTIAGVAKANGKVAMQGNIDNLADGLFIADAGGLALTYHQAPVRTRGDFKRPTRTASWIEMNPRQYYVKFDKLSLPINESEICIE